MQQLLPIAFGLSVLAVPSAAHDTGDGQAQTSREGLTRVCAQPTSVTVQAAVAADAQLACEGAARALAFLARAGLAGPAETRIDIADNLPGELAGRAVGGYLVASRRIVLLSLEAFEAGGGWFRMPPSQALYRAAAAHEMAHAVVGLQARSRPLPVAAHEYVAYVVLFATMDPSLRAELLQRFPGPGFRSVAEISDLQHIVEPNQFGVAAWRHYLGRSDRGAWLRQVIAGEVVIERVDDPDAGSR